MTAENIPRSISMKVRGRAVIEFTTPRSAIRLPTNCATGPGNFFLYVPVIIFFSHVWTGLHGIKQYKTADKVACSRTQHSDFAYCEAGTSNPLIPSLTLYQLSYCALLFVLKATNRSKILQGSHRNSKTQFHDFSMINNVISMTI